jgi:hypothetical protein
MRLDKACALGISKEKLFPGVTSILHGSPFFWLSEQLLVIAGHKSARDALGLA